MDPDFVLTLLQETLATTVQLAGPLLMVSLVVGLVVSILQAATQIQEMTLVFVPKMLAVFAAIGLLLVAAATLPHNGVLSMASAGCSCPAGAC